MNGLSGKLALLAAGPGLLLCLLCAVGCSQETSALKTASKAAAPLAPAIAWFEGSVDEAFAVAAAERKPLFLYWGARWCPPCNQLKSTVFTRPDFVAQSRRYVAYRLDGDDPAAQRWAAHFGAMGYPTLIVFDSQGQELTRLSSGMQLERYAEVLQRAPESREVALLVALWQQDQLAQWSLADWEQVAYYPWGADLGRTLPADQRATFFSQLYASERVPHAALRRRILLLWAGELLQQEPQARASLAPAQAVPQLQTVLATPEEWRASLSWLQYHAVDWIARITAPGTQRAALLQALESVMEQVWAEEDYGLKSRLLTLRSHLDAAALQSAESAESGIPAELLALVEQRTAQITKSAQTPYERQSLVYNAAWYLHEVGRTQAAADLLKAELDTAIAPHYYMSYLGRFAQALGQDEEALQWYEKAFAHAVGAATRMQWGLAYVGSLLELTPEDDARILAALEALTRIAQQSPDSLYQRSRVRLERLRTPLAEWAQASAPRAKQLAAGRSQWQQACRDLDPASSAAQACKGFWPNT